MDSLSRCSRSIRRVVKKIIQRSDAVSCCFLQIYFGQFPIGKLEVTVCGDRP
jgi:hypothetical protein